jgi:imidazolonepropionase-like amidohydrolase
VEEAALYETHVAAHAHGAEGIKRAVLAGVRSIEHGSLMDDESIALHAEHGTYLVADIWMGDWTIEQGEREHWSSNVMRKLRETTDVQREGFAKALEAGSGSRSGPTAGPIPHGMNAHQFATMVKHGMTPIEAIRSATVVAAELLGWRDRVGAIEPGCSPTSSPSAATC